MTKKINESNQLSIRLSVEDFGKINYLKNY